MLSVAAISVSAVDVSELTEGERALLSMQRADANGDGQYSTDDVSIVLKVAAGILKVENEEYYDLDLDGIVTVKDAQLMLKTVSGVGNITSDEGTLAAFNTVINGVKNKKPGFTRSITLVCPAIKVTTSGAPISSLNVSNMEYKDYVKRVVDVTSPFATTQEMKDELPKRLNDRRRIGYTTAKKEGAKSYAVVEKLGLI
jgi:hypothetical protein